MAYIEPYVVLLCAVTAIGLLWLGRACLNIRVSRYRRSLSPLGRLVSGTLLPVRGEELPAALRSLDEIERKLERETFDGEEEASRLAYLAAVRHAKQEPSTESIQEVWDNHKKVLRLWHVDRE